MGPISRTRLTLLAALLLLASAVVYSRPAGGGEGKPQPLAEALARLDGWRVLRQVPLDLQVARELRLDDYAFLAYTDGREVVSVYVGYYFSADKVGAPHHPLVCFSGQGWQLSEVEKGELYLGGGAPFPCAQMRAARDLEEQFIVYWFQAFDTATSSPFRQKISLVKQRLLNEPPESAFVRLSLPIHGRSTHECRRVAQNFVDKFYPAFLAYIHGQSI